MSHYYSIRSHGDRIGIAFSLEEPVMRYFPSPGRVEGWKPIRFELRPDPRLGIVHANFGERLPANMHTTRIFSEPLMELIQEERGPKDDLQWLPVFIRKGKEERPYYILHFPAFDDVLDWEETIFREEVEDMFYSQGRVMRPAISRNKAEGHDIFTHSCSTTYTYVSRRMRKAILDSGLTSGVMFETALSV